MNNQLYNADCADFMADMNTGMVDLTITSPPYDNLRNYNGYSFPLKKLLKNCLG